MEEEIKILEEARAGDIRGVMARAKTKSAQLASMGGDKLNALEQTESFLKIKKIVPPPHITVSHNKHTSADSGNFNGVGRSFGKKNYFPIDRNDGLGGWLPTDEAVQNRYMQHRLKLPAQAPVPVSPQSGIFSKTLEFGSKAFRFLPLIGELWTRKENALLANAHALTEACVNGDSDAVNITLYVGAQYAYRGFGFLSFVPNLADSATPENIQKTLNFLARAGCFEEYRMFVDKNKGLFADLGLLDSLSVLSDAELRAEERSYRNMQIRLNPSQSMVR